MEKDNYYIISLGHNCIPAYHLNVLGLRKESLPFDWLLSPSYLAIDYATELIDTEFQYFLTDLQYNDQGIVIPGKYPELQFYHHDLLKKSSDVDKDLENSEETTILAFKKRAKRMLEIMATRNVFFINVFHNRHTKIAKEVSFFWNSIDKFTCLLKKKNVTFRLLIIIYDNADFNLEKTFKPSNLLSNIFLRKFIRNTAINQYFGCEKAFGEILQEFFRIPPIVIR